MFNWFKRPAYAEQTTATDDMMLGAGPEIKMIPMPTESVKEAIYTIGNTDGKTQFRVTLDSGSVTLTMTTAGVIDLIEDLAHSIRKDYNVVIVPEDEV